MTEAQRQEYARTGVWPPPITPSTPVTVLYNPLPPIYGPVISPIVTPTTPPAVIPQPRPPVPVGGVNVITIQPRPAIPTGGVNKVEVTPITIYNDQAEGYNKAIELLNAASDRLNAQYTGKISGNGFSGSLAELDLYNQKVRDLNRRSDELGRRKTLLDSKWENEIKPLYVELPGGKLMLKTDYEITQRQDKANNTIAGYLSGDSKREFLNNGTLGTDDIGIIISRVGNPDKATTLFKDAGFTDPSIVSDAAKRNQYQKEYGDYIKPDGTVLVSDLLNKIEIDSVARGGVLTGEYNPTKVADQLADVAQTFNFKDFDRNKATELVTFSMATPAHKFEIMKASGEGGLTKNDFYTGVDEKTGSIQYVTLTDAEINRAKSEEKAFLLYNTPGIKDVGGAQDPGGYERITAIEAAGLMEEFGKLPGWNIDRKWYQEANSVSVEDFRKWYNELPKSQQMILLNSYDYQSTMEKLTEANKQMTKFFMGVLPVVSYGVTIMDWNQMSKTEQAVSLTLDTLFAAPFIRMGAKPFVKLALTEGKATGVGMQAFLETEGMTAGKMGKLHGAASVGEPVISNIGNKVKTFSSLDRLAILQSSMDSFTAKALDKELWRAEQSLLSGNAAKIKAAGLRLQSFGSSMIRSKIPGGNQILNAGNTMIRGATELAKVMIITPSYVTGETPYAKDIEEAIRGLKNKSKEYWSGIKNSRLVTEQRGSIGWVEGEAQEISKRIQKLIDKVPAIRRDNYYKAMQRNATAREEATAEMMQYLEDVYGKNELERYIATGEWAGSAGTISGPESSVLGIRGATEAESKISATAENTAARKAALEEVDRMLKSSPEKSIERQSWSDAAKLAKELNLNTDKVYHLKSYAMGEGLTESQVEELLREYSDSIGKGVHAKFYRAVGLRVKELREIARGATAEADRIAKERKGEPELQRQAQTELQKRTKTITKEKIAETTPAEVKIEKSKTRITREERTKKAETEAQAAEKKAAVEEAEKLTEAEKARLKDREYWRQKARDNWTEKQREVAIAAATRIATKTATATDADLLADTLSRVLSKNLTQSLTKAQVATLVKTLTELLTKTHTGTQAKTKTLTQTQTKTLIQVLTKILTKPLIKTETQTKPQTKTETKTHIIIKTPVKLPPGGTNALEIERVEGIPRNPGIVVYDMGFSRIKAKPPFRQGTKDIEFEHLKTPTKGKGSEQASLRVYDGDAPQKLILRHGWKRTSILRGEELTNTIIKPRGRGTVIGLDGRVRKSRKKGILK